MFVVATLDLNYKAFVVHIVTLNISFDVSDKVYPLKKAQIAHIKADEALIKVFSKYTNFANVFLLKLAIKPPKYTGINNHVIKLVDD